MSLPKLAGGTKTTAVTLNNFFLLLLARLPYKTTGAFFIICLLFLTNLTLNQKTIAAAGETLRGFFPITQTFATQVQELKFTTQRTADNNLPDGEERLVQPGHDGRLVKQVRTLAFQGTAFATDVITTTTVEPSAQIIAFGTKKANQNLNLTEGSLNYWKKLTMYATSYDSTCRGCNDTTAIGLKAGYGVVAVDPKVIPLRTKLYIPGYGYAIAGDTGGSIKGDKIDLGFDNVQNGWWSARYTDVYLLSE